NALACRQLFREALGWPDSPDIARERAWSSLRQVEMRNEVANSLTSVEIYVNRLAARKVKRAPTAPTRLLPLDCVSRARKPSRGYCAFVGRINSAASGEAAARCCCVDSARDKGMSIQPSAGVAPSSLRGGGGLNSTGGGTNSGWGPMPSAGGMTFLRSGAMRT